MRPIVEQLEARDCPTTLITPQLSAYLAAQERCSAVIRDWTADLHAAHHQQQIWSQEFRQSMLTGAPLPAPPDTIGDLAAIEIEHGPLIEAARTNFAVARDAYFASLESPDAPEPAELDPQLDSWDADIAHALAGMMKEEF